MTLPVAVGAAGLLESALGLLTTSFLTGGSSSWDPMNPGPHKSSSQQAKAEKILRQALAKLQADADRQQLIDIWTTSANQQALWNTAVGLQDVADIAIPHALSYAKAVGAQAQGAAKTYTDGRVSATNAALSADLASARTALAGSISKLRVDTNDAEAALSAGIAAANTRIVDAEHQAVADAQARIDAAVAQVERDIVVAVTSAENYADAIVAKAIAQAKAGDAQSVAAADAYTDLKIGQLIAAENGDLRTQLDTVWTDFHTQVRELQDLLTQDDPAAARDLSVIPDVMPTTDPLALVAAVTAVTAVLRTTTRCTVPNCRNLSQLGRDLAALATLVEDGVLLAFLLEMAHDPGHAAALFTDTLGGIISGAVAGTRSLIGV